MTHPSMDCRQPPAVPLARREFLKLAGLALAAPLLGGWRAPGPAGAAALSLGRITLARAPIQETAGVGGVVAGYYAFNDIVEILGSAEGDGIWEFSRLWYQTPRGYVYSPYVQLVENAPQPVDWHVPPLGYWAEVSVPFADSRGKPDLASWRSYRLYYGSVYRVVAAVAGPQDTAWYGLAEWTWGTPNLYVPAEAMRRLTEADLAPLSLGADKYIRVTLSSQLLEAYEGTQIVFTGRVASGAKFKVNGEVRNYATPRGRFRVVRKGIASHMTGGTRGAADSYDLPGVPYCTYITASRVAVHGAYWHNEFGRPRSHGCVNMLPVEARWVYRWTEPSVPYDARFLDVRQGGTTVEVVP